MNWVALTKEDILPHMGSCELEAIESAGDATPSSTKIDALIKQITDFVRLKVQSCHENKYIGASGTIPESCVLSAAALVRHSLLSSLPALDEMAGKLREDEYSKACKFFDDIASCTITLQVSESTTSEDTKGSYGGDCLVEF